LVFFQGLDLKRRLVDARLMEEGGKDPRVLPWIEIYVSPSMAVVDEARGMRMD
jgi:hypothetical protein